MQDERTYFVDWNKTEGFFVILSEFDEEREQIYSNKIKTKTLEEAKKIGIHFVTEYSSFLQDYTDSED